MKLHEKRYQSYRRNHKGKYLLDEEKSKIQREKNAIIKMQCKAEAIRKTGDLETREVYEDLMMKIKKTKGNSKSHKQRLSELEKNKDFN